MQQPHADDNLHHTEAAISGLGATITACLLQRKTKLTGCWVNISRQSERGSRACRQVGDEAANRLLRIEKIDGLGNVRGISDRAHLGHS